MADEQDKRPDMPDPAGRADPPQPCTAGPDTPSRLRREIDNGTTGDKVAFDDPAAAPLGTDDEAAGTPNSAAQVRLARAAEVQSANEALRDAATGPNGTAPGPMPSATTRAGLLGQAAVRRETDGRPDSDTAAAPTTAADLQGRPAGAKTSLWVIAAVIVAAIVALMLVF